MTPENRNDMITRDSILKRLSDDEVARVSTAETAASLAEGDQYIDLEQLEHGVLTAQGPVPAMGQVLPRKAVAEKTWNWIARQVEALAAQAAQAARP